MSVVSTSLRRPVTVIVCTIAIVVFGLMVYTQLSMQDMPDTDAPVVSVSTTMTGASATVMDNDVTDVIEEQLNSISGVSSLSSSSYQGKAVTVVEFDMNRDIDAAAADVRDKVNLAAADLPDEADTPVVSKLNMGDDAILQLAISGPASYGKKVYYIDKVLKTKLQAINGVGTVTTAGMRDREIRIWVDPAVLRSRGLVTSDIATAISEKHVELPAGSVIVGPYDMDVRVKGEYASVEELRSLPIKVKDGTVVRLGDIARVEDGFANKSNLAFLNDNETMIVGVKKQRGTNEVELCNNVVSALESIKKSMPAGMEMKVIYNGADYIKRSISGVESDIIQAVLLCALLMLFFLQTIRATFVTVVTMPVCLIGSFIFMKYLGITINNMSMMGITLSVGMVVDATTVVLENVDKRMSGGMLRYDAAEKGANEVSFSVIGGALTTMAVFSPVAFMGGIIGRVFYAFGVTVIVTIGLSLILSLTLTPFLCSRILEKNEPNKAARFCLSILEGLERAYGKLLKTAVAHRAVTMGIATALFIGGLFLMSQIGTQMLTSNDKGSFMVDCELPSGTEIDKTGEVIKKMCRTVRQDKAVSYTYTEIGNDTGSETNKGTIYVHLRPKKERGDINNIMDRTRQKLLAYKDVKSTLTTSSGKDVEMVLVGGSDTNQLLEVSKKIIAGAEKSGKIRDIETDVRIDKPQLEVNINRGMADAMDVNIKSLTSEIQAYFGGEKVGIFKDAGYRYNIRVMSDKKLRSSVGDLNDIYFKNGSGSIIQAPGIVSAKAVEAPNVVKRYGRLRSLSITANVTTDYSAGQAVTLFNKLAAKYIPAGSDMRITASGQTKNQSESFARLAIALIVAIILVYVIMAIQFESFLQPFAIMFSLPLMTPGAFGLLWLANCKLDIMSYMGIILLVGIVVNNGIILIDFINQERAKGMEKVEAVVKAGPMRLRAILITALSTLIGAIPAALKLSEGSESRQPMSIAIFGGLFTSTLLTLFVVPVVYLILEGAKEKLAAKLGGVHNLATLRKKIKPVKNDTEAGTI